MAEAQKETKKAAAPKAAPAKKAAAKPAAKSGKTLKIVQIGSPIGRQQDQRQSLIGLGLGKIRAERELEDTPAVRGMINRVKHLVRVVA